MVEVEKKVRLDALSRTSLEAMLRNASETWSAETLEVDRYFRAVGFRQRVQTRADYLARVRVRNGAATLNCKKLSETTGVVIEHETSVGSAQEAEAILRELGAEFACVITKRRRRACISGVDILLDEIEELGTYLEVSLEVNDKHASAAALERIDALLDHLGASEIEFRGYPDIVLEREGVVFDRTKS